MSATSTRPSPEYAITRFRGPVGIEARRRRRRSIAVSIVGVVLVALGAIAVSRSSIFSLQRLSVVGGRELSDQRIARLAGLSERTNVVWLSTSATERRLLASPWIASATVSRSLPSTVTVTVRERQPVAVGVTATGRRMLISTDGVVLGPASEGARLPQVQLPSGLTLQLGSRVSTDTPALRVAAGFPRGLVGRIATIELGREGIELQTRDGVRVIYGDASDPAAKGSALGAVLVWIQQHHVGAVYVDVSAPTAPAVLPAGGRGASIPGEPSVVDGARIAAVPGTGG